MRLKKKAKDLTNLSGEKLVGNLMTHEITMKENIEKESKKKKSIDLKPSHWKLTTQPRPRPDLNSHASPSTVHVLDVCSASLQLKLSLASAHVVAHSARLLGSLWWGLTARIGGLVARLLSLGSLVYKLYTVS